MQELTMAAAGDVLVDRANPATALDPLRTFFEAADLVFGNFEGALTDMHAPTPGSAHATVVPLANAAALGAFDVMSLANNHAMDAGYGGLSDTIAALADRDVAAVGAGGNIRQALEPAVFERGDLRVAVIAVTSVFRAGVEARCGIAGVAPLRADDYYGPRVPGLHNPGLPPRIVSVVNEQDWDRLAEAMARAHRDADLLVVSIHWGDYSRPWVVTDHERSCGRRLVDAGADVVLGHHQHVARGAEFIAGKPVLYGLGHLIFDHPRFVDEMRRLGVPMEGLSNGELAARYGEYGIYPRPETPTLPFHPLARHVTIAVLRMGAQGVNRLGLVPCWIDSDGTPRLVRRGTEAWRRALRFLRDCQRKAQLRTHVADTGWSFAGADVIDLTCQST